MTQEFRNFDEPPVLLVPEQTGEEAPESRKVAGYAAVFSSVSEDMGFREVLAPGAITDETIKASDVFARFNHDSNKILARSKNGEGSLHLSVDERGLRYEFEAPNTANGDELLESLKRGDISQSSFAFTVNDADERWAYTDGVLTRTITKIDRLYDVAPVYQPAYSATTCANERALERAKVHELRRQSLKERLDALEKNVNDGDTEMLGYCDEMRKIYEDCAINCRDLDKEEQKMELRITTLINNKKVMLANAAKEAEERKSKNINVKTSKKMTKKVSLNILPAVRAVLEGRSLEGEQKAVNDWGRELAQRSGNAAIGQIFIPTEKRGIDIATEGADVVGLEIQDILEHLYGKATLAQAGARFLTGLTNDIQFPILNGSTTAWTAETGSQAAGTTFGSKKLTPYRLTSYVDISKQFLNQTSASAESVIQQDIVNSIYATLESTILGTGDGKQGGSTVISPLGIFNASATLPTISAYSGITALEARVENANVAANCAYIVSNSAKAALRNMAKSTKTTALVMEDGAIDGTPVYNTSNVAGTGIAYGDWSKLVIGQWGALDVTVDPYSQAYAGNVRLVVNSYWDAKVLGNISVSTSDTGVIAVATC